LHGIDVPGVRRDNTLNKPYNEYKAKDRVDVVLTNPPFGGQEEDGIEKNFPAQFQTRETADLFLVLIMRLLKEGGRCALVLPDGFLFGEGVKTRIKERLLKENNLHSIVRLPKGVFAPYTSINTNLLFFEKGGSTDEVWYFEHIYPEGYKSYSKTKPIRIEEFDVEKEWWVDRKETDQAWKVATEEIEKRGYNLDIKNPNSEENQSYDVEALLAKRNGLNEEIQNLSHSLLNELKETLA
jgi:type I restriction enzyme M protein